MTFSRRLAVLAAIALAIPALPARAYVRSTVEGDPETELAWPMRDLEIQIADETSADVAAPDLRAAIQRSFTTWTGAGGCTDIELIDAGPTRVLRTNLMGGTHDGQNRIVFREDAWPEDLGPETLGITTLVYRRSTGEILDADVDINAVDHIWSAAATPSDGANDVENTMTHELGHFLGFAHVPESEATMFGQSDPGDVTKRDLATDDVLAVCYVYPTGARTPGGDGMRTPISTGCTVSSGRAPLARLAVAALALALVIRLRRARRRAA